MIKNRREFLFIYDVSFANPNGDPANENRPRIDEETGINYVTPDRLKRIIRDQLILFGKDVFVREERDSSGIVLSRRKLKEKYGNNVNNIIEDCIDIRLFGITLAIEKKDKKKQNEEDEKDKEEINNISLTGPVQFKFGKSLHRVSLEYVKGTTVLPSGEGKKQGTMTEKWILPYSLIAFYGIANENASKDTNLTDDDINDMIKAMWVGVKANTDILSTSKMGHNPRLLIEIIYKENTLLHIGDLDNLVSIKTDKKDEEIRSINEVTIDLSKLKDKVVSYKEKIEKVRYIIDSSVKLLPGINEVFGGIQLEEIKL